ncbi:HAD family acid phosphatase [Alteromonas oceanisediminis]|uniref:HAD family acid phosphatase n=1 Tax=Alteromonas oceanisediminis TaxID=2836180 RepID=UPI001BDAF2A2|nr:HAD family acid phosphatase [Alteromonas oceanisediminis]MBT0585960.1 endonuclease/exonuclease/phosphatase family protein [Alteromonas oceanisediminis]
MKAIGKYTVASVAALLLMGCAATGSEAPSVTRVTPANLSVATWNVEHLAYPSEQGCRPRSAQEIAQMKRYAASLNADVVGLQEVASADAVALLFPADEWNIILSPRADSEPYTCRESGRTSTQQKVAFAVRKSFTVSHVTPLPSLALGQTGLRYGLAIEIATDIGNVSILNVHLKSGCYVDNASTSDKHACAILTQQAPVLRSWIDTQEESGQPYLVIGDFNHRLTAPYNHLTQALMTGDAGRKRSLINTSADLIGCHPYYPAPIDMVFVGNVPMQSTLFEPTVHPFEDMRVSAMLSDHCAVSTTLTVTSLPLTNAVKWQTTSKEYQLLTTAAFRQAAKLLQQHRLMDEPWVVVMDVDETILDNSAYQVMLDRTGRQYTSSSWAEWVKLQQATLVPGAADFIDAVFSAGGKVALITNREKTLDAYTWTNLTQWLDITAHDACLVGRSEADKTAINGRDIVNDKDLRRVQLRQGAIECFAPSGAATDWAHAHRIVMQIGDNVEDFSGVTQEAADIQQLSPRLHQDLILLPNPMYGSW